MLYETQSWLHRPCITRQRYAWHPLAGGGAKLTLTFDPVAQNRWSSSSHHPQVNSHVKFESDRTKTAACIVPTRFHTQSTKVDLDLWNCDPKPIGSLLSSCTTYMWSLKEIGLKCSLYRANKVFFIQNTKGDLDLWPCDPKSIWFLFSSCTTYMWSLKVLGLKL